MLRCEMDWIFKREQPIRQLGMSEVDATSSINSVDAMRNLAQSVKRDSNLSCFIIPVITKVTTYLSALAMLIWHLDVFTEDAGRSATISNLQHQVIHRFREFSGYPKVVLSSVTSHNKKDIRIQTLLEFPSLLKLYISTQFILFILFKIRVHNITRCNLSCAHTLNEIKLACRAKFNNNFILISCIFCVAKHLHLWVGVD